MELPCDLAVPFLGVYPKELKAESQRDICTLLFIAVLFTLAKGCKQLRRLSVGEWINKMWCFHTMKWYSASKRKEILTHAKTWMNLQNNVLREISQSQNDNHCVIPLI